MTLKQEIGKRISQARRAAGLTIKALSDATQTFSSARISNWEQGTRSPGPNEAMILANNLGVAASYLLCLTDNPSGEIHCDHQLSSHSVPLINFEEITTYLSAHQLKTTKLDQSTIPLNKKLSDKLSPDTFAFSIIDNSMQPDFNISDIIIVDPSVSPNPGDYVIAHQIKSHKTLLRKYREIILDNHQLHYQLIPSNHDWATLNIKNNTDIKIIATVIAHWRNFRV